MKELNSRKNYLGSTCLQTHRLTLIILTVLLTNYLTERLWEFLTITAFMFKVITTYLSLYLHCLINN